MVPGKFCDDRAHLLIARGHQESWRAAIAFHSDDEEILFRVAEFDHAMRAHGAAGMQVGVDQRREGRRGFDHGIKREAQFGQN